MSEITAKRDKAGKAYWSSTWANSTLPGSVDPYDCAPGNYVIRRFHELFSQIFSQDNMRGHRLLEIGCARSVWLPYFVKQYGLQVSGIDYSEVGCQQARAILEKEGVIGEIVCADFFDPPTSFIERFDMVISFGVAEHFSDTAQCVAAFAKYLVPGGVIITLIPNMTWIMGLLQRLIDKSVYDVHVPVTSSSLKRAHEQSGLEIMYCRYFLFSNFSVLNTSKLLDSSLSSGFKRAAAKYLGRFSKFIAILEKKTFNFPSTRYLAPYIVCVSKKSKPA